jgi:phosphoribosylformylglycinamidine cyclo-ligase
MAGRGESESYRRLGVSASKDDVHRAVAALEPGLLPSAFCRVNPDLFHGDPDYCVVSHADGAGTKSILAYLKYRLTGDAGAFRGIAQDAVVMNLDDLLCVGATSGFVVASIVNRHARRAGAPAILDALVAGTQAFAARMGEFGVRLAVGGGETADVGDVVRTVLVDAVLTTRMERRRLLANDIRPGLAIVALASGGAPARYEDDWNSGIGCNGLTAARHELLGPDVAAAFPEAADDLLDRDVVYRGPFHPNDVLPGTDRTVLDALLSPTRTFAPVVRAVLDDARLPVRGMIHVTGGGHTKCLRFGRGVRYVLDLGDDVPAVFRAIRQASGRSWLEMAKVFNLGYRMLVLCERQDAGAIVDTARSLGCPARVAGATEVSPSGANELALTVAGDAAVLSLR